MRLSKNISEMGSKGVSCTSGRVHYSADRRIAASAADGRSQFALIAPSGMYYIPSKNEDAVVIPTDSGRMCIGVRIPYNTYNLEPGELLLRSEGGTMIVLKNDGKVIINGEEY